MLKLVTAEWMRQIDREAIERRGIPGEQLMEKAGQGIAERILEDLIEVPITAVVAVFCGKGNNGGDGYVIARHLHQAGCAVTVYFVGPLDNLSPDGRVNFDKAADLNIKLMELTTAEPLPTVLECNLIVDALLGTGFSGPASGLTAEVIRYINDQPAEIVAVDMPSGLNADDGSHPGEAVRADFTYPLGLPKYGLFISPGRELAGQVDTIPIGIPDDVVESFNLPHALITGQQVSALLPQRAPDGHKGTFGKLFLLAGSTGMTGAACLASISALRSGCGVATLGCPASTQPVLATKLTEVMTRPFPDVGRKGFLALRGLGEIAAAFEQVDAAVIGPGLGRHHETAELLRRLIKRLSVPAVIDADALNALEGKTELLDKAKAQLVLTPHPGEFERLSGQPPPHDIRQRMATASQFARAHNVVLVFKGSPAVVASPDGAAFLNPTGNHGMATAGSGDVLSGLIGSFLAQGMVPLEAALCGVFVHGFAGDLAADELTPRAMIAGDIVEFLPNAFEWLE